MAFWNTAIKLKYFPSYIHHLCFCFIPVVVLSNVFLPLLVAKIGVSLLMQTSLHTHFLEMEALQVPSPKEVVSLSSRWIQNFILKILEKNYFCLVCMNAGVLIICWVTKSMINMFQWFQYKCFLTVCWPYYHGVSEVSLAMYEKISKSILKSLKTGF